MQTKFFGTTDCTYCDSPSIFLPIFFQKEAFLSSTLSLRLVSFPGLPLPLKTSIHYSRGVAKEEVKEVGLGTRLHYTFQPFRNNIKKKL